MSDEKGFVYLAVNESMPELVKIGMTMGNVQNRMKELSADTGVPTPFTCLYSCEVQNPAILEKQLHEHFDYCRENNKREFFRTDWQAVKAALLLWGEKAGVRLSESDNASSPKVRKFTVIKWAKEGNAENLRHALAVGGNSNQQDENKKSALMWAIINGHEDVVKILLENDADPTRIDKEGYSPLMKAVERNHAGIASMLLGAGANPDEETAHGGCPLLVAIKKGFVDTARALLENGANQSLIVDTVSKGRFNSLKVLLDAGANPTWHIITKEDKKITLLGVAVNAKQIQAIKILLDAGANPDEAFWLSENRKNLAVSLLSGRTEEVNEILMRGDIRSCLRECLSDCPAKEQLDLLAEGAVRAKNVGLIKELLDMGATSTTILIEAVKQNHVGMMELVADKANHDEGVAIICNMVREGAEIHADILKVLLKNCMSPQKQLGDILNEAIDCKRIDIIKMALDLGIFNRMNKWTIDGMNNAINNCDFDIVEILLMKGASAKSVNLRDAISMSYRDYSAEQWKAVKRKYGVGEACIRILKMLLNAGADPNTGLGISMCGDSIIPANDAARITKLLRRHGANVNKSLEWSIRHENVDEAMAIMEKGEIIPDEVLRVAARYKELDEMNPYKYYRLVGRLLKKGGNPKIGVKAALSSGNLDFGLHIAAAGGLTDEVCAFLAQGVTPTIDMLNDAKHMSHHNIVRILRNAGVENLAHHMRERSITLSPSFRLTLF